MYLNSKSNHDAKSSISKSDQSPKHRNHIEKYLEQLKSGKQIDSDIFEHTYDTVQKWFRKLIYTRDPDDYLDIIDEALAKFLERKDSFRGNTAGEFYFYMKRNILTVLESTRMGKKHEGGGDVGIQIPDPRQQHAKAFERNKSFEDLYGCIDTLPETLRGIIYEILAEIPKGEIAAQYNISASLLSQNLTKAYASLRSCLSGKGYSQQLIFE